MTGADGSTTFTDASNVGRTLTNNNAEIDTAIQKFTGGSGLFSGSNSYLTTPVTSDLLLGTDDFTLEAWVYPDSQHFGKIAGVWSDTSGSGFSYGLYILGSGEVRFAYSTTGGNFIFVDSSGLNYSTTTWQHIAATRDGNDIRVFHDGVQVASTNTAASFFAATGKAFEIGRDSAGPQANFDGNLSNVRLTTTLARYTSAFTPPIAPFPTS